jgi:hypothetical protein
MPVFKFAITVPATMTAQVEVEADTIEEAQDKALSKDFYRDPEKASFELDEGNALDGAYLPDEDDYEVEEAAAPGM